MADYYPLLARAVAALPNSTRDTRAAIYERARKALLGQLRSLDPPVSEEHLQNESNALDDAIARLEGELAQDPGAAPAPPAPAPVKPAPPPRPVPPPPPSGAAPSPAAPAGVRPPPPPPLGHAAPASGSAKTVTDAPKISAPPPPPQSAPAKPAPPVEQAPDRKVEKTVLPPAREPAKQPPEPETPAVIARPPTSRGDATRPAAPSRPETGRGVSRQMLIWIPLILLIGGGIGFAAWRLRVPQEEFAKPRATVAEAARPQGSAKINDRAGTPGSGQQTAQTQPPATPAPPRAPEQPARAPTSPPAAQPQAPQQQAQPAPQRPPVMEQTAPVAQRSAILIQAAVNDMQNVETHVGTTVWRQEESRRPGANGSPAVRADVDLPAVGLKFVVLIEKNNDTTLRASHMMTLRFLPQEGSSLPGIVEIGSPQMRNEGAPNVEPLAGAQAKITDNIYIVALSADPNLTTRNIDTLKTRGWFDFPMRLSDGRISKITVEKGAPGDRILEQALEQWQR